MMMLIQTPACERFKSIRIDKVHKLYDLTKVSLCNNVMSLSSKHEIGNPINDFYWLDYIYKANKQGSKS